MKSRVYQLLHFFQTAPVWKKNICILGMLILLLPILLFVILWKLITILFYLKEDRLNKRDYIERANWLCRHIIVEPEELMNAMPKVVGRQYQGEWAIYSLAMTTVALYNISRIYPKYRKIYAQDIKKMIDITMSPTIQEYDASQWGESPLESLDGDKSHMTYLSLLAWMITNYKFIGGDGQYDDLLHRICEALYRRMQQTPELNLKSFPHTPIFIPDMLVTIVALNNYAQLYDGQYADMVWRWIDKAKNEWIDRKSGLLAAMIYSYNNRGKYPVCGSYAGLTCYYLSLIDENFACKQYLALKHYLANEGIITAIKERNGRTKPLDFHIDAGPLLFNFSPSGTAFAIGCATHFEDWEFRNGLLRTAELAATTIYGRDERHYLLGSYVPVGEAITLAMKTNYKKMT